MCSRLVINVFFPLCIIITISPANTQICTRRLQNGDIIRDCCVGYERGVDNNCQPICHNCTNGTCVAPARCECNEGFKRDRQIRSCVTRCVPECVNGRCVGDNMCACNEGYSLSGNNTCLPFCVECANGRCLAPHTCACNPGYAMGLRQNCEPLCEAGCLNGHCDAPDVCVCKRRYKRMSASVCAPICDQDCPEGKCSAPNVCIYEVTEREETSDKTTTAPTTEGVISEEKCEFGCLHGKCIAPNVCECYEGYARVNSSVCYKNKARGNHYANSFMPVFITILCTFVLKWVV